MSTSLRSHRRTPLQQEQKNLWVCEIVRKWEFLDPGWSVLMMWVEEEWRQRDRWTSPGSRGYVPGKVGLLCPREGRGICCIANWWSLVNCRVGRKLELTNQTGLFQRSWQVEYFLKFTNITDGVSRGESRPSKNMLHYKYSYSNDHTSTAKKHFFISIPIKMCHYFWVSVSQVNRSQLLKTHLCREGQTGGVLEEVGRSRFKEWTPRFYLHLDAQKHTALELQRPAEDRGWDVGGADMLQHVI